MKNFLYVLAAIAVIWLSKLSYDVMLLNNQLLENQSTIRKSEQGIASLNDQLVALQRKTITASPELETTNQKQIAPIEVVGLNPVILIQQKLELVQFAVQQQQYIYAIEQLNEVHQFIEKNDLAETLKYTLHTTISQDKHAIEQYVASRAVQEEQLENILQSIELSLKKEAEYSEIKIAKDEDRSWWSQWFKFDRVTQNTSALVNRKFILKEVELRLILAQHALARGAFLEYQSMMDLMITELNQLPDEYSATLKRDLVKLKQAKMNPVPKLSSLSILEP